MSLIENFLLGTLASLAANSIDRRFQSQEFAKLERRLEESTYDWAAELPDGMLPEPAALFQGPDPGHEVQLPLLEQLHDELRLGNIPSAEEWARALYERWAYRRTRIEHPVNFFEIPEPEAERLLLVLGRKLEAECSQSITLFNPMALNLLREIASRLQQMTIADGSSPAQEAAVRYQRMEGFSLSSGRPQSEDEARKESTLIRQIILVCFYERFKTAAQKSTIALIHTDIDSNLFFTCPYRALTGDVAAKLRRFIGEDRSRVATEITEPIDKLMSEGWEVKGAGLMEPHAYTPYQIELDTDLRKLSIIPADPITEPPHETLETTSGLLQSVPKIMQYHGAAIAIEFDRLPSSAFDLYYALAVEESFAFSRIYVAENDPEAWTYVSADTKGSEVLVRE